MLLGLAGCKSKLSPSDQVATDLESIKNEEIADNFLADSDEIPQKFEEESKVFVKKLQEFEYTVIDEKTDKEKGTSAVTLKIKTYNFGKAYEDTVAQVLLDAKADKIGEDADITEYVYSRLYENLNALKDKSYEKEITVNCTESDGNWETDIDSNREVMDAVMGGMMTAVEAAAVEEDQAS